MEKNICIVGCGGIGSYLAEYINDLKTNNQLPDDYIITVSDSDVVDDTNIGYQNFDEYDISDFKAEVVGLKYDFNYNIIRVESLEYLDKFDIVIGAVDNVPFRELLFKWGEHNKNGYWIDLRSEGRNIAYYIKHKSNNFDFMMSTIDMADTNNYSCQLRYEVESGIIQQGNKIIAMIGSQLLLNHIRGEFSLPKFSGRF